MRNISFMLTTDQVRHQMKDVTRRLGWASLRPGQLLAGVEKAMGLKRGEKVQRLAVIRVKDVRSEQLRRMLDDLDYGISECAREGFRDHPTLWHPRPFTEFFCASHSGCTPDSVVTRIEFEYIEPRLSELPAASSISTP